VLRQFDVGVQELGRHPPGTAVPLGRWHCGMRLSASLRMCVAWSVCLWSARTGTRLVTAVPLGRWHCWNAVVGFAQYGLLGACVCPWSAHTGTRLATAAPSGRWHCWNAAVSFAQNVCCLVCVCAYGRRTPALAWSRQCPRAAGIVGMRRSASHSMWVAWWVCAPMVGAPRHSPGHAQCPWAAGIVGMRRSASLSMCVAWFHVCLWSAHTGAHQ
jgi:hypothetical protein